MESHLAEAVEQGDVTSVIQQLRQGADVNLAAGLNGTTALMEAAILGNVDILTILLSCSNINLNQQDLSGQTALYLASCHGHAPFVSALLQHPDIDPNLGDARAVTPLLAALLQGHHHIVLLLLRVESVDPNLGDREGHTPLTLAAAKGQSQIVAKLLSLHNIRLTGDAGRSAVRSARENGYLGIAETIEVEISLCDLKSSSKYEYGSSTIEQRFRNSLCLKDI